MVVGGGGALSESECSSTEKGRFILAFVFVVAETRRSRYIVQHHRISPHAESGVTRQTIFRRQTNLKYYNLLLIKKLCCSRDLKFNKRNGAFDLVPSLPAFTLS